MKKIVILFFLTFLNTGIVFSKEINVAYTIDNNYAVPAMLSINSILKNNKSNSDYTFYIIENNLSWFHKWQMRKFINKNNQQVKFIHMNTNKIDKGNNYYANSSYLSKIAMARIIMPELVGDSVDKIIYLDADILANEIDLIELYNYDLSGLPVGMACDGITYDKVGYNPNHGLDKNGCKIKNFISFPNYNTITSFENGYYNSGVIIMDLDVWRKEDINGQLLKYIDEHKKYFSQRKNMFDREVLFGDQDLINIVLDKRIKTIPQNWNNQGSAIEGYHNSIIHYCGKIKPWSILGYKHVSNDALSIYIRYWDNSDFKYYKYYFIMKNLTIDRIKNIINIIKFEIHIAQKCFLMNYKVKKHLFWDMINYQYKRILMFYGIGAK